MSVVHSGVPLPEPSVTINELSCIGPFRGFLCLQPSLPGKQNPVAFFFTARCYMDSCLALVLQAEYPSLGFRYHTSQGSPWLLKYPSGTSAANPGRLFSPLAPPLHSFQLIVVKWFLLSDYSYKASIFHFCISESW